MATAKQQVIKKFQTHDTDTGSAEVITGILSEKIDNLAEHLKVHKKDKSSRRGLVKLVDKRRKSLQYLRTNKPEAYKKVTKAVGLKAK